jgi:hypothetical protein
VTSNSNHFFEFEKKISKISIENRNKKKLENVLQKRHLNQNVMQPPKLLSFNEKIKKRLKFSSEELVVQQKLFAAAPNKTTHVFKSLKGFH